MSRQALVVAVVILHTATNVLAGDLSAKLELSSARIFRGVEQTDNNLAPSGAIRYQTDFGLYAGALASQNDFRIPDAAFEQTYFLGYGQQINSFLNLDLSVLSYNFIEGSNGTDWEEVHLRLNLDQFTAVTLNYARDWIGNDDSQQIEVSHLFPISNNWNIQASAGAVFPDNNALSEYFYGEVGVVYGLTSDIYIRADLSGADSAARTIFGDRANSNFRLSVGYIF